MVVTLLQTVQHYVKLVDLKGHPSVVQQPFTLTSLNPHNHLLYIFKVTNPKTGGSSSVSGQVAHNIQLRPLSKRVIATAIRHLSQLFQGFMGP